MKYIITELTSNSPESIDNVEWLTFKRHIKATDRYNSNICEDDFLCCLNWAYDELVEQKRVKGLEANYFFNLPKYLNVLQTDRISNESVRFSFVLPYGMPNQFLEFLSEKTHFAVESIAVCLNQQTDTVSTFRYINDSFIEVNSSSRDLNREVPQSRFPELRKIYQDNLVLSNDPREWFESAIELPCYQGLTPLHTWFAMQGVKTILGDAATQEQEAVWHLRYNEELSDNSISGCTGIPESRIESIILEDRHRQATMKAKSS
ncbi:MAG: hypothetical protein EBT07_11645 [Actinobacteria bacterium]|nr:hypothetical protein [Actinomycetota bacterium]